MSPKLINDYHNAREHMLCARDRLRAMREIGTDCSIKSAEEDFLTALDAAWQLQAMATVTL